jgi:hypothetical protein
VTFIAAYILHSVTSEKARPLATTFCSLHFTVFINDWRFLFFLWKVARILLTCSEIRITIL